jgi:transketolase
MGVAEQNMLGVATGLAEAGFVPFAYSIATFAALRTYEFFRNGAVFHDLPVRLVGIGGGFDYDHNGASHWALEDAAIMRAQPDVTIVIPADREQVSTALDEIAATAGPVYLRLARGGAPVPGLEGRFKLGRAALIGSGEDIAIVVAGTLAHQAVAARQLLADHGVGATVCVVSSLNPAPVDDLLELIRRVDATVTVDAGYLPGGLGSLVAEVMAEHGAVGSLVRLGVPALPRGLSGSEDWLNAQHGLNAAGITEAALAQLNRGRTVRLA